LLFLLALYSQGPIAAVAAPDSERGRVVVVVVVVAAFVFANDQAQ